MTRRGALRAAALAALLAAACGRAPPPDLSRNPADLLAQVRDAQARVASCRGPARVAVSSPQLGGSLDAWIAAALPAKVRIEIFDFFGNPAAVLAASGGRFALYDPRQGVVYRGDDTRENLARLLPVPLGARELARVVCGSAPILDGRAVAVEDGDGVLLLEVAGADGREILAVGEGATVRSAAYLPGPRGGVPWKAAFSVFRHTAGAFVPTEIELRGGGSEVGLRWKDEREVNGPPDDALFRLATPRGARVVELAPGAAPPPVELPIRPATSGAR